MKKVIVIGTVGPGMLHEPIIDILLQAADENTTFFVVSNAPPLAETMEDIKRIHEKHGFNQDIITVNESCDLDKLADRYTEMLKELGVRQMREEYLCEEIPAKIDYAELQSHKFRKVKPYDRKYLPKFDNSKNKRRR